MAALAARSQPLQLAVVEAAALVARVAPQAAHQGERVVFRHPQPMGLVGRVSQARRLSALLPTQKTAVAVAQDRPILLLRRRLAAHRFAVARVVVQAVGIPQPRQAPWRALAARLGRMSQEAAVLLVRMVGQALQVGTVQMAALQTQPKAVTVAVVVVRPRRQVRRVVMVVTAEQAVVEAAAVVLA